MLDNPYAFGNHRRFAAYGIERLTRMGFFSAEALQALSWLSRGRNHALLLQRPPSRKSSFRPFPVEEVHLFSEEAFRRLMQMYSLRLLSIYDVEQLLAYIQKEALAPVDADTLDALFYELFPVYSARGTPFFAGLPDPERAQ